MNDFPPLVMLTASGLLAAFANLALGGGTLVLPRLVVGGKIRLGFVAQALLCLGVAFAVDHDFKTAFLSALCGSAVLRQVKARMDTAFGKVVSELGEP